MGEERSARNEPSRDAKVAIGHRELIVELHVLAANKRQTFPEHATVLVADTIDSSVHQVALRTRSDRRGDSAAHDSMTREGD